MSLQKVTDDTSVLGVSEVGITALPDYAHVYGVVHTYPYSNDNSYMLRGIQVELWEDKTLLPDERLATVYTVEPTIDYDYGLTPRNYITSSGDWVHVDNSGYFDFGDVYVGSGGKDLYFKIYFVFHDGGDGISEGGTEKLVIRDANDLIGDDRVNIKSPAFHASSGEESGLWLVGMPNLGDGSSISDEATHIYYDIVKTYGYFRDLVGYTNNKVTAYIDITNFDNPQLSEDDGYIIYYNRGYDYLKYEITDTIIHEYSHTIHYGMRGGSFPPLAPGDVPYGGCNNSDSSDALVEGWARFVPTVINKDPIYNWGPNSDS